MAELPRLRQSPTDPAFVQDPYGFYTRARAAGPIVFWEDYDMPMATTAETVGALLRDRRLGREIPNPPAIPERLAPFYAIDAHSMLELEPPRHTRLRSLVLRAFTSRRIAALAPEIETLTHELIDTLPEGPFDLLPHFAQKLPVIIIARLLGIPEERAPDLLAWSNAMVAMYQARRTPEIEDAAVAASLAFTAFLRETIAQRRRAPGQDLLSELIAARDEGDRLSEDELISTVILLLNAGHEATVHTIGNGVKALLETGTREITDTTVEEILRYDPPLHLFTRHAYEPVEIAGHRLAPGDEIGLLLASANRDEAAWPEAHRFDPTRPIRANTSFGAGIHFCVGAPLARLELAIALPALFARLPDLTIAAPPRYADLYHFHGLEALMLRS